MALAHSPRIITDGLVLCLDAANTKSFNVGISTTAWNDLSRNGNNATLVNGPTFSSANNGILVFNGSFGRCASCSIPALTNYSLSFWIYLTSLSGSERQIFGSPGDVGSISILSSSGVYKWHSYSGAGQSLIGVAVTTSTWYNFVMTRTGSTTNFYVNGSLSSTFGSGVSISSGTGYFCDLTANFGRQLNANLGNISFYNRALTASEVSQNFNALRERYGI